MNTPDAESLKNFVKSLIEYEKQRGLYNPLNWIGIE
jgi:predicted transcriptional regulator